MDLMREFEQSCAELRQFRAHIAEALATTTDPEFREHLEAMTRDFDKNFQDYQQHFPPAVTTLKQMENDSSSMLRQAQEEIVAAQAALAEAERLAAAGPPVPTVDDEQANADRMGEEFGAELWERYADPRLKEAAQGPEAPTREAWQDWSRFSQDEGPEGSQGRP